MFETGAASQHGGPQRELDRVQRVTWPMTCSTAISGLAECDSKRRETRGDACEGETHG